MVYITKICISKNSDVPGEHGEKENFYLDGINNKINLRVVLADVSIYVKNQIEVDMDITFINCMVISIVNSIFILQPCLKI